MSFHKITADYVFDGQSYLPEKTILIFDEDKKLIEILPPDALHLEDVQYFRGLICPGLINAHCHTELSHLRNQISQHTGLLNFLIQVITKRHFIPNEHIKKYIIQSLQKFKQEGVVAIGDICNTTDSVIPKSDFDLYFHHFIEVIGFDKIPQSSKIESFQNLYSIFQNHFPLSGLSFSPHAPYSLSASMFDYFSKYFENQIITMHNQEMEAENHFYQSRSGDLLDFYKHLYIDYDFFKPSQKSSILSVLPYFNKVKKLILVHNLFTSSLDIEILLKQPYPVYFCICINANLFIQNALPPLSLMMANKVNIVLGTDSLASNKQLSMIEEMKTIGRHFPNIPLSALLQWATINGACALDLHHVLGSFTINKFPGVVGIHDVLYQNSEPILTPSSYSKKIL